MSSDMGGVFVSGAIEREREPCVRAGLTDARCRNGLRLPAFRSGRGAQMPLWLEILVNVIGYAGFIAIATFHKPSSEELRDR